MTSDKKIAANRTNAKKSTGPRTVSGKSRSCQNAWRHGWATTQPKDSVISADVEHMANVICGNHPASALHDLAVIIAECQILLGKLRAARLIAIERNRIPRAIPERRKGLPGFPSDEEWAVGLEALERGRARPLARLLTRGARAVQSANDKALELAAENKSELQDASPLGGEQLHAIKDSSVARVQRTIEDEPSAQQQEDVQVFERALPELIRLDRYERRIITRRKRAIRMFDALLVKRKV
jgi:hypothetical protein